MDFPLPAAFQAGMTRAEILVCTPASAGARGLDTTPHMPYNGRMPDKNDITITVFGSSRTRPDSPAYDLAYRLGAAIGARGWTLCNGGYGGLMAASAKGAKDAGAHTIGVTCQVWGRGGINRFIDREVSTTNLYERLQTLVDLGRAYVALPGGTGTLLELAFVWELANKKLLQGRPIVLLGDCWRGVVDCTSRDDPGSTDVIHLAADPHEAAHLIAQQLAACVQQ
jgi:uncharacterized protein (TIGR00730 family)